MKIINSLSFALFLLSSGIVSAQPPVAHWSFDQIKTTETVKPLTRKGLKAPEVYRTNKVSETATGTNGQIFGAFHKSVPGVVGNGPGKFSVQGNQQHYNSPSTEAKLHPLTIRLLW